MNQTQLQNAQRQGGVFTPNLEALKNAPVHVRLPQIREWSDNLSDAIDQLEKVTETLLCRIQSISRNDDTNGDTSGLVCSVPDAMLVPMAETLRIHTRRLKGLSARIEAAAGKVEL